MKSMKRILCIALALVLSLSILAIPASAAVPYAITIDLVDNVVGVDNSGQPLHRIVAYVDSTHSLYALQLSMSYDKSAFYPVNATTLKKIPAPGTNGFDKTSTDIIFNDNATIYEPYVADGYYAGDGLHNADGYAYFANLTKPEYAQMSDGALGAELVSGGYAGYYWTWMTNFGDNYLIPSGGKESAVDSPLRGKVAVCAIYLAEQPNAAPGTYKVGINGETQVNTLSGTYVTTDVIDSLGIKTDMESIPQSSVTYNSAEITIGAAAPALTHVGRQVKMDVAGGAVVSGTEQLRVVSSISNDDWNAYFANTTNKAATSKKLLEVGIVATQGAFDMTAAQDAAKLGKGVHGDYTVATTTYIQNTGSDYRFGARIEYQTNVFDTTYVAFAKYLNAEGAEAYVFYDASYALAFAKDYGKITQDYINFLNSQAA